ncbi:MAG TPA: hypothetical protein VHU17_09325 [Acidimicrobiales bacterium]|nr:hypothetical protein [Acidimicrobiales bacterium]
MEVLAGFVLGYLLGTETGAQGVGVIKDAIGSMAGSGDVQSVMSGGMSTAQGLLSGGLLGGLLKGGGSVKEAFSDLASNDQVKGIVSTGMGTAQAVAFDLLGRGKEMVSQQRSKGLRLVI